MAQVIQVSPTTITFDLQYPRKEARETIRETIREYTTEQLPLQLRTSIVAVQNVMKQGHITESTRQQGKIQALEHYLDCHKILWTLIWRRRQHG